jgi:hypothetical protein
MSGSENAPAPDKPIETELIPKGHPPIRYLNGEFICSERGRVVP